jgi:parallel beta-helix repeat protein
LKTLRSRFTDLVGDAVLLLATGFLLWVPVAEAKSVTVKCGKGTISKALSNTGPLTVVVQGICMENVIITGDDVTLKGDPGATVIAADAAKPNIVIDGARRVLIADLRIQGGINGILGQRGSAFDAENVTVQNAVADGIRVVAASATILSSTISQNGGAGVAILNGASARLGIREQPGAYLGNTIAGNGGSGVTVLDGASAYAGGNLIDQNTRFGVQVSAASANLVGGNTISNNGLTGVNVSRGGQAQVGDPVIAALGLTTTNLISGNGTARTLGLQSGIYAIQGSNIRALDATISGNTGPGAEAYQSSVLDFRGTTAVTAEALVPPPGTPGVVSASGGYPGVRVSHGSTLRIAANTVAIISPSGDGIEITNLSAVLVSGTVQGNGTAAVGINCFPVSPGLASAATLTGSLANVSGTAGSTAGCNTFP